MPRITVLPDGTEVTAAAGKSVLAALYESGYGYRVGCRRGGCGVCKVDLVAGQVEYRDTVAETVLSQPERASGTCLTCRAIPLDDVTIQLRNDRLRRLNPFLPS
ncbi:2Fe-2S iron-sulfur cluster-binding protein [Kibdelosporangium aridum]|nr:2Fe-2S iron-sulfur cluster-binding protein [Kibdelosporangium aridum]